MEGLLSLAKTQGATGNATRGACKICGGLGHLTKACKNGVSGHKGDMHDLDLSAAGGWRGWRWGGGGEGWVALGVGRTGAPPPPRHGARGQGAR